MFIYLGIFNCFWILLADAEHIAISDPLIFIPILSNAIVAIIAFIDK